MTESPSSPGKKTVATGQSSDPFKLRAPGEINPASATRTHVYGKNVVCDTESRGFTTPRGEPELELALHNSAGFIPLWAPGMRLHWRFRDRSLTQFSNSEAAKTTLRELLDAAILAWGQVAPLTLIEDDDVWDFEVVVRTSNECIDGGYVLATAFLPDSGRHEFTIYPIMLGLSREDQIETLVHELGHVFGLRHFFANLENEPSVPFGEQSKFTIMNYGPNCALTDVDKTDLSRLYQAAWNGTLTFINETPIRLVKPFNTLALSENPAACVPDQTNGVADR